MKGLLGIWPLAFAELFGALGVTDVSRRDFSASAERGRSVHLEALPPATTCVGKPRRPSQVEEAKS